MTDPPATTEHRDVRVRAADGRALTRRQIEKLANVVERGFREQDLHSLEEVAAESASR